jgi:hypothetical protein
LLWAESLPLRSSSGIAAVEHAAIKRNNPAARDPTTAAGGLQAMGEAGSKHGAKPRFCSHCKRRTGEARKAHL